MTHVTLDELDELRAWASVALHGDGIRREPEEERLHRLQMANLVCGRVKELAQRETKRLAGTLEATP